MPRTLLVFLGVVGGIALTLGSRWALHALREAGCEASAVTKSSPDNLFRARLTFKQCAWGFGLAASFASLRLEKLGSNGWFLDTDLDTDQPTTLPPAMNWDAPHLLHVTIISNEFSGSLDRDLRDMHLLRTYVSPGRN